jgi:hypothetical protein
MLLGATGVKAAGKYVGEIDPKAQGWAIFFVLRALGTHF